MAQKQVPRPSSINSIYGDPEDDLPDTLTKLQWLQRVQPEVAEYFEQWSRQREVTIDTVDRLHKSIDALCENCNVGRDIGAGAAIVGFISGVVGIILKAKGIAVPDQLMQGSKYCTAAGTAIILSSNVLEACRSYGPVSKIKGVIVRDIELTDPLRTWITFSQEVKYRFDNLLQCNVGSPTFVKVMEVCGHCSKLLKDGNYKIKDIIRDIERGVVKGIKNVPSDISKKVRNIFKRIQAKPNLIQKLGEICMIFSETPYVFRLITVGAMIHGHVYGIMLYEPFAAGDSDWLHCSLDTIKMLFRLLTKISFTEIKKRQSEYSESLNRVKFALKSELVEVTNIMNQHQENLDYERILELTNIKLAIPQLPCVS